MHHRKLKSRGGLDEISNVVALHHHCHNLGTESVHLNVEKATAQGLLVSSWDDPRRVPLTLPSNALVLLTPEGYYEYLEGTEGAW